MTTFINPTYHYFPWPPEVETFTASMARGKLGSMKEDFPDFSLSLIAYNNEGIAVFGFDKNSGYCLLWASPSDNKVKKIEARCDRLRDGGTSYAIAYDQSVRFKYSHQQGNFYINDAEAKSLTFRASICQQCNIL